MADLFLNTVGTDDLDLSLITLLSRAFIVSGQENIVVNDLATVSEVVGGKTIDIVKYPKITPTTTALTEGAEVANTTFVDTKVTLTPEEYGQVVTKTSLVSLQSGGLADLGIADVVGKAMAESWNRKAITTVEASTTNLQFAGTSTTVANVAVADTLVAGNLQEAFTTLQTNNVSKMAGDSYVALLHPHVFHDLLSEDNNSSWINVAKYSSDVKVFKNEMGMLGGMRLVVSSGCGVNSDVAGDASNAVDGYITTCLGVNALGIGVSTAPSLKITGPFDKLGRMVHVGWYGVYDMAVVDTDAIVTISSSASLGTNV